MPMSDSSRLARVAAARLLAAGLFAALCAVVLAQGQPPPGQQGNAQPPTFRAGANLVRVDVYPTSDGKPVTDLRQEDFEVFEDNVPQEIRSFEHVVVRAPTAEELAARREPGTIEESRQMAAESKARLFVLYLDTYHISRGGAMSVRDALVRFLRKALGPDDLIAVTTPELPASTVAFSRQTGSIEDLVDKFYGWSRRDAITEYDPIEEQYMQCYPPSAADHGAVSAIAREMIERRRERITLESLGELVQHLGSIREERKAVLAVSEGWVLYPPSRTLTQSTAGQVNLGSQFQSRCDADRQELSMEDHQRDFRNLVDDANRANVSFYPLDPRGLAVFDQSLAAGPLDAISDARILNSRLESLQTLASATDGLAVVNTNDIDRGLRRVVDDLTSYYLLGYYSTNSTPDGKFRAIKVRVRRPGVDLRYRRGYRAATREEMARRDAAPLPGSAPSPVAGAIANLSRIRADAVVHALGGYSWQAAPDGSARPTLWVVGEWDPSLAAREPQWKPGAEVTVVTAAPDRTALVTVQKTLTHDVRSFEVRVPVPAGQAAGDYNVRVTTKPAGALLGTTETLHIAVPRRPPAGAPAVGQPALFRRGPFTGPAWVAAGDLRFRRQERVKVEVAVAGAMTGSGVQLLDRAGHPLAIPVTASVRDEDGARVIAGEAVLAPLGVGDYLLEVSVTSGDTTEKVLAAFRIVP
jgi:VWFA-related protein